MTAVGQGPVFARYSLAPPPRYLFISDETQPGDQDRTFCAYWDRPPCVDATIPIRYQVAWHIGDRADLLSPHIHTLEYTFWLPATIAVSTYESPVLWVKVRSVDSAGCYSPWSPIVGVSW